MGELNGDYAPGKKKHIPSQTPSRHFLKSRWFYPPSQGSDVRSFTEGMVAAQYPSVLLRVSGWIGISHQDFADHKVQTLSGGELQRAAWIFNLKDSQQWTSSRTNLNLKGKTTNKIRFGNWSPFLTLIMIFGCLQSLKCSCFMGGNM